MEQWLRTLYTCCSLSFQPKPSKLLIGSQGFFGLSSVAISLDEFNSHLYVVGQSGQGKSKFLQQLLYQLCFTNWGCGVFDPHSDLASDLLAQLAAYPRGHPWLKNPANCQRLIYLDPSRDDYLVPFNIFRSTSSTPYEIAENLVEAFRRVWPDTLSEAPRFAQILRNAALVLALKGLSLLELEPLLTNPAFRRRMLADIPDPLVVSFFTHQFDRWGREQAIFASPVLNKVSAFLFKPQVRCMLGANDNYLDFRRILDEGKVLIVNLGGFHDEETQRLLGSLLVTSLEQAAFSRSTQAPSARRPFFCTIDEFPLFCSRDQTSLARILSECRKYRLHLGLAHQTITQLPGERIHGALENAKLKVIFGTGRQTAQAIVGDLFMPDPQAVKHEVTDEQAQERSHPLYNPLAEQFETSTQTIQRLSHRRVLVKLPDTEQVAQVRVPVVPKSLLNTAQLERLKAYLAQQVGEPRKDLETEIAERAKAQQLVPVIAPSPPAVAAGKQQRNDFWQ
ncbi:MAG: hypothetical protein DCC55_36200 [Chloroflexi bacterium]|nr:MAG: hypothetical protein DCC55_36200 [Chloroflexota bacterium]